MGGFPWEQMDFSLGEIHFAWNMWISPGENPHLHVCLDFSPGEIQQWGASHGNKWISHREKSTFAWNDEDFSWGEIRLCMYVWISPRGKSRNGGISHRNKWISPTESSTFAWDVSISPGWGEIRICMYVLIFPGRNPPMGDFPWE